MPVFDQLQRASFGGIEFPVKTVSMKCSFRHHEHIYLKTPGAATEKMSRGLYTVNMGGVFDANIAGYGKLWPNSLAALRRTFELGTTADLVVPTVGTIPAFMTEWSQEMDVKIRSGENVPLTFQEDQSAAFIETTLKKTASTSVLTSQDKLNFIASRLDPKPDIFDKIQDKANKILAIFDEAKLQEQSVAAKIDGLSELIREADRDLDELKNPDNFDIIFALQDLLAANLQLARDLVQQDGEARLFTVPSTMTLSQLSVAIYGDTSHASEILTNNTIDDPFSVIAGTKIIYFATGILHAA